MQVVMLGRYNAQGLGEEVERYTKEMVVTEHGLKSGAERKRIARITEQEDGAAGESPHVECWVRVTSDTEYIKVTVYRQSHRRLADWRHRP